MTIEDCPEKVNKVKLMQRGIEGNSKGVKLSTIIKLNSAL